VFVTNVPLPEAVGAPNSDQVMPLRTSLPSPHVKVSNFGLLAALLQLVSFSGDAAAEAGIAKAAIASAAASRALAERW
jgi:hypothetical protein